MKFQKVAVVVAHPDDVEIGCFGTLAAIDAPIHILILTDGELGVAIGDAGQENLGEIRRRESTKALAQLNCEIEFGGLKDGQVQSGRETILVIERFLKRISPDLLITHPSGNSADHQDHIACAAATLNCAYRIASVRTIWYFEPIRYRPQDWAPNVFVEISAHLEAKVQALATHDSQQGRFYLTGDWVRHRARQNALLARSGAFEAGEAYEAFTLGRQAVS